MFTMNLNRLNPMGTMSTIVSACDSFLYAREDQDGVTPKLSTRGRLNPVMKTFIEDNVFHLRLRLAGVDLKDVHVSLSDNLLTISGKKENKRRAEEALLNREVESYTTFSRSIRLPEGVDSEDIRASFDSGVLEVTVPLPEFAMERNISDAEESSKENDE